jgi:hypothetical protein
MARDKQFMPVGKNPKHNTYHNFYDRYRMNSKILNKDANQIGAYQKIWDRDSMTLELESLIGDADGQFKVGKQLYMAAIPFTKSQIKDIEKRFKDHCKKVVNEGREKPTEMPKELYEEKLKFMARLDVHLEEVHEIERRLKTDSDKEIEKSDSKVLHNGPQGNGRLLGGYLIEIDGMNVSLTEDKIPFINDIRAKQFDGFSTADYYKHIVKPWLQAKDAQAKKNMEEAKKNGVRLDQLSRGKLTGSNVPIPNMPSQCINYKTKVEEEK